MFGDLLKKIVGSKNDRELKRIRPMVDQINGFEQRVSPLTDDQLRAKTAEFKERIGKGESLDEILFLRCGGLDPEYRDLPYFNGTLGGVLSAGNADWHSCRVRVEFYSKSTYHVVEKTGVIKEH